MWLLFSALKQAARRVAGLAALAVCAPNRLTSFDVAALLSLEAGSSARGSASLLWLPHALRS